jgi:hypothetical protein
LWANNWRVVLEISQQSTPTSIEYFDIVLQSLQSTECPIHVADTQKNLLVQHICIT